MQYFLIDTSDVGRPSRAWVSDDCLAWTPYHDHELVWMLTAFDNFTWGCQADSRVFWDSVNELWVAVYKYSDVMWSEDFETWTGVEPSAPTANPGYTGHVYNNGRHLAIAGQNALQARRAWSTDGKTWSFGNIHPFNNQDTTHSAVAYSPSLDRVVIVGWSMTFDGAWRFGRMFHSSDNFGATITARLNEAVTPLSDMQITNVYWSSHFGKFFTITPRADTLYSSTDGISWTKASTGLDWSNESARRIVEHPSTNRMIIVGDYGSMAYSTNGGSSWTDGATETSSNQRLDVGLFWVPGASAFVIHDRPDFGIIERWTMTDGTAWTKVPIMSGDLHETPKFIEVVKLSQSISLPPARPHFLQVEKEDQGELRSSWEPLADEYVLEREVWAGTGPPSLAPLPGKSPDQVKVQGYYLRPNEEYKRAALMNAWVSADSLSLADFDPVASWDDHPDTFGTNGFVQNTSSLRPVLRTNQYGGVPVVRFDGTQFMVRTSAMDTAPQMVSNFYRGTHTIFIVCGFTATTTDNVVFGEQYATNYRVSLSRNGGISVSRNFLTGSFGRPNEPAFDVLVAPFPEGLHVLTYVFNGALSYVRIDGRTFPFSPSHPTQPSLQALRLGNDSSGTNGLVGDVAEMGVSFPTIGPAETQMIERDLASKWGVTLE